MPPVEIAGMLDARGPLHPRTRDALEAVRRAEEKAIVLLNRRGWSNFLSCQVCGRVCPPLALASASASSIHLHFLAMSKT
jgi:primosomal protein N' (replication factor Y)